MPNTFERDGARFAYPENWVVELTEDSGGWVATVQSPGTAFLLVALHPDAVSPAELADEALDTLKTEYKELDAEDVVETVAGRVAVGHDIDFLTLDTAIACQTRCVDTPTGPLLLMCQSSEFEREQSEPVFRAVFASLTIEDE